MKRAFAALAFTTALSACGYVDRYEEGVHDYEPTYCYAALGDTVECFREPQLSEGRRLVNYYGKHPSRYGDAPPKPQPVYGSPPPPTQAWVKDPEPVVKPGVYLPHTSFGQASVAGSEALVREANENLTKAIQEDSKERLGRMVRKVEPKPVPKESEGAGATDSSSTGAVPFR